MVSTKTILIGIFYFSGTGNTKFVSELIKNKFDSNNYSTKLIKIEYVLNGSEIVDYNEFDIIGIGHPIHAWDSPRIIYNFVKQLPEIKTKVFLYKTAAGYSWTNSGASYYIIKRLKKKGYQVFYDRIICMGSNWLMKYDDQFTKLLSDTANEKVGHMVNEIISGESRCLKINFLFRWMFRLISITEHVGVGIMAKDIKVKDTCNGCNICIKICPVKNIYKKNNKIKFGIKCMMCMRCFYKCPTDAISYRIFKPLKIKEGYKIKEIVQKVDVSNEYRQSVLNNKYKKFKKYIENIDE